MNILAKFYDTSNPQTFWAAVSGTAIFIGWMGWLVRGLMARKRPSSFEVHVFPSARQFDAYLERRWRKAESVKAVHLSSKTLISRTPNTAYVDMLDNFVRSGGIYQRVISASGHPEILEDAEEFLRKHAGRRISIYVLPKVIVDGMRVLKIMLIDDSEVCLGGGLDSVMPRNTISIRQPEIVAFFVEYFAYLVGESTPLEPAGSATEAEERDV